jgi:hypothetical protein
MSTIPSEDTGKETSESDGAAMGSGADGAPGERLADSAETPDSAGAKVVRTAVAAVVVYALFDMLLPLIPIHPHHSHTQAEAYARFFMTQLLPTGVFMMLQVWLASRLVALRLPVGRAVAVTAMSTVLWFAVLRFVAPAHHLSHYVNFVLALARPTLLGLFLTVGLSALGMLLSRIIRERNVLLPVALVAMPIDYVGAMTNIGFTNNVVKNAPSVVAAVSVPVPHVGGLHPLALIGPGDALFMAFFFSAIQRLRMNERGTFWWMASLLAATMLLVLVTGLPIAALVPMGIAVIAANAGFFKLKREEVFAVIYAALIVFVIVGVFYVVAHRYMAVPPPPTPTAVKLHSH